MFKFFKKLFNDNFTTTNYEIANLDGLNYFLIQDTVSEKSFNVLETKLNLDDAMNLFEILAKHKARSYKIHYFGQPYLGSKDYAKCFLDFVERDILFGIIKDCSEEQYIELYRTFRSGAKANRAMYNYVDIRRRFSKFPWAETKEETLNNLLIKEIIT